MRTKIYDLLPCKPYSLSFIISIVSIFCFICLIPEPVRCNIPQLNHQMIKLTDRFIMPVNFYSFNAYINKRDVTLSWITTTETNNYGFEIERFAVNGNAEWKMMGFVRGNGTTNFPVTYNYTDVGLTTGKYFYRVKQIDLNGSYEYFELTNEVNIGIPRSVELYQNFPNPFNPVTKINYDISYDGFVNIKVFDITGRVIMTLMDGSQAAGYYSLNFNVTELPAGVYFYSLIASGNDKTVVLTKKMTVIK